MVKSATSYCQKLAPGVCCWQNLQRKRKYAMFDLERCPELRRLPDLLYKTEPLPKDFLDHARGCEICFFWTTWALAVGKALATTNRIYHRLCPTLEQFQDLLFGVIYGLRKPGVERIDKNICHASRNNEGLWRTIAHINRDNEDYCPECARFYSELYPKMIGCHERLEKLLSAGNIIEFPVINVAKHRCVEKICCN